MKLESRKWQPLPAPGAPGLNWKLYNIQVNGTLYKEYHYGIGWDDLIGTDLFGNEVVTSYGKHWNFLCRVTLQDILEGGFDADGIRDEFFLGDNRTIYDFSMNLTLQYANGTIEVLKTNFNYDNSMKPQEI